MRYFDYNATTPVDEEVAKVMMEGIAYFGNPSSVYTLGKQSKVLMENSKRSIASLLGANYEQIFITSGGSESNNTIIKGFLHKFRDNPGHFITSCIEHPSVTEVCKFMVKHYGFEVTFLPVDQYGFVNVEKLKKSIRSNTRFVSIMLANNEIGTIQPIREISEITKERGIFLHTDAVQVVGKMNIHVEDLGVDALSFSAHKFYGPKGIGGIFVKDQDLIEPLIHGGGQEKGFRSGTENLLSIIGLGKACEMAREEIDYVQEQSQNLKSMLINSLKSISDSRVNGPVEKGKCLPNTINVTFSNINGSLLTSQLNEMYKIAVSVGSACSSQKKANFSHVLTAIGLSEEEIKSSIRISIGKYTTENDIAYLIAALKALVENQRNRKLYAGEEDCHEAFN